MKYSKKKYNYYSDDERMSYIREYLSSPESKSEFCKRHGFCAKLLTYWLNKYQIEDKDMGRSSKPVNSDAIDSSISELQKELSLLRAENRKLHRALADESLRHEACEELINLANPRIISRYEKTPMPSNRHLVTEVLIPTQTWLYKVPL